MAHVKLAEFSEFPAECLTTLGGFLLKRNTLTARQVAEHGMTILAYGLNVGLPADGIVGETIPHADAEMGQVLLDAATVQGPTGAIPWPIIIPIVLEILRRLIK